MNRTSNSVSAIDLVTYQHVADIPLEKYDGTGTEVINTVHGLWLFPRMKNIVDTRYGQR